MIGRLLALHAGWVVHRPRAVRVFLAALTLGALLLLPRFSIDPDVGGFLPEGDPALKQSGEGEGRGSRSLFVLLRGPDLERRLPELVARLRASPHLARVDARREELGAAREAPSLAQLPLPSLDALEARLAPEQRRAAIAESRNLLAEDPLAGRALVLNDPLGLRWILEDARLGLLPPGLAPGSDFMVWPQRELALLRVEGRAEPFDVPFSRALMEDLGERLAEVEWSALGGYDIARRDAARIRADLISSLLWSIPLLFVFLACSTRSLLLPHFYLAPVLLAVLWALAYGGALLGPLTPLAVSGAAILMGLGIDFALHYLDRYLHERAGSGPASAEHGPAVLRTHAGTGPALSLGLATTLAAFLAVCTGSFPGMVGFGLLLCLGLIAAWFATLSLAPLLGRALAAPRRPAPVPFAVRAARRLVHSRAGWPVAALLGIGGLGGWALVFAGQLDFDADARFLRPVDERFDVRAAELEGALGHSPLGLRVLVPGERSVPALAAGLERLLAEGQFARATGEIASAPGPARAERLERFRARTRGWVAATLEDLAAAGFDPEPFRAGLLELERRFATPPPAPSISAGEPREDFALTLYPARTPRDRAERGALRAATRAALGADVRILDAAGVGDELGPLLARDLRRSLGWCALLVVGLLALALRRPRHVLAALAPVTCGLGLVLGALALSDFPLHPGNLIALPLILGLGVDDGIHMLLRWREGEADPLTTTGASIWRTSGTTILAFGSLGTAASPAIASLGLLAALGALVCFLASVLVVPLLLGPALR